MMTNPAQGAASVYVTCVNSVGDVDLRNNLSSVLPQINAGYTDFDAKAIAGELYQIPPDERAPTATFLNVASKQDFKNLYTQQMATLGKPARTDYDRLIASAPKGKCPLCGYGQAKTLDHYLPKSKYPQFSVYPPNLVPACTDCNFGKRSSIARTKDQQGIHPYFDSHLMGDQWLFAEVVPGSPATLRYFVEPPSNWDPSDKARVRSHFDSLKLSARLAVEAADELSNVRDTIRRHSAGGGAAQIRADLLAGAEDRYAIQKNSWQTALYQALAVSVWYCNGGYEEV
ncbi:HNH endonuclease [Herbaspirillum sp. VT-16-41]|uniref:HNH endonuclease n=1 Tax=Herbaspirillum sp. VT-16-41 TaxID=1953765 RepID=UPI001C2C3D01|nr:hypothetical protein [Herbaspirillum sp. VT-16-41]